MERPVYGKDSPYTQGGLALASPLCRVRAAVCARALRGLEHNLCLVCTLALDSGRLN